jgi:DNA-binding beta-propeller fold protein YncE
MVGRLLPAVLPILMQSQGIAQASKAPPHWRVVADVPLPGKPARFDYQSLDSAAGILWIAHMGAGEVLAFDVRARHVVARVPDMPGVTGVRVVPSLQRVFASLSAAHEVAILDTRGGRVLARVPAGRFPDGLAYAPTAQKLFVSDEYGRQEIVIDVPSSSAGSTIPLGGEAGNTQYDATADRIWVAVQTRGELVAIDPGADAVALRVPVPGIEGPHGFLVDPEGRFIYVTGEKNGRLGMLDLHEKRIVHTYRVGDEPDVLAMDPAQHRLFVAAESGVISAFEARGDSLVALPSYHAPAAHSVAVDPTTHLVYVPLEAVAGKPVLRILRLE